MSAELTVMRTKLREMGQAINAREDGAPNLRDYGWARHEEYRAAIEDYHAETRRMREEREAFAAEFSLARGCGR